MVWLSNAFFLGWRVGSLSAFPIDFTMVLEVSVSKLLIAHSSVRASVGMARCWPVGVVVVCSARWQAPRRVLLARAKDSLGLFVSRPRPTFSFSLIFLLAASVPGHSLIQCSRVSYASWHSWQVGETSLSKTCL